MSKFTVGMDTGGTFTDAFFSNGEITERAKVDTTPHDLTVCFMNCLQEGSMKLGFPDLRSFLKETETIKFSSTIGSNTLIQLSGPKLGAIVTKGFESNLYRKDGLKPAILERILKSDMVKGIDEETDRVGHVIVSPSDESVRLSVEDLLEKGARIIIVSLRNAFVNGSNEQKVKGIVHHHFPRHYLGSVPVLISTQISSRPDDHKRTNSAVLDAYFHKDMVTYLYKAEGAIQKLGYPKPLFIVLNNGGISRLAKSRAIDTYGAGPTAGVIGAAFLANLYKLPTIASMDIGGTSTDISLVHSYSYKYDLESEIEGIPVGIPTVNVVSLGGGGGSIANITGGNLKVGPGSQGAIPGPACYDLGGTEATPTDANVVLGFIDPKYFLGGRRQLNSELAHRVCKSLADKLGMSIYEVSHRIREQLEDLAARSLRQLFEENYLSPKGSTLFSFGGAGGMHCCAIAERLDIDSVIAFNFSSVFCAFGAALMNISHLYENYKPTKLTDSDGNPILGDPNYEAIIDGLKHQASIDLAGEGFLTSDINYSLDIQYESHGKEMLLQLPSANLVDPTVQSVFKESKKSEMTAELFRLRASRKSSEFRLPIYETGPPSHPREAMKMSRDVQWKDSARSTAVYDLAKLKPGNIIPGPAIIEANDSTYVVNAGWLFEMDKYMNGQLRRTTRGSAV